MSHRVQLRARSNQHFVYSGRSVLVTNLDGLVTGCGTEGFYAENTRVLSRLVLSAGGQPLTAVAASPVGGSRLLGYYEARVADGIPQEAVYLTLDWRELESRGTAELEFEVQPFYDGRPGVPQQAPVAPVRQRLRAEIPRLTTTNDS